MNHFITIGRIIFLSFFCMEVVILLFRFSSCYYRREFFMFLLVIIILAAKTMFSHFYFLGIGTSLLLVYVTGNFIYMIFPDRVRSLWTISVGVVSLIIIILMILHLIHTIYFSFFYLFITGILFFPPLYRLWRLYKNIHSKIFLYLLVISILFIFAKSFDLMSMIIHICYVDMTLWISICLIAGLGYMIFQQGYPVEISFAGARRRQRKRDTTIQSVFSRLVQTENTILLQDRLITSGLLSVGTSHEFKNVLTHIKTLSQSGLTQEEPGKKDTMFREILDNIEYGINVIKNFFSILALRGEEEPIMIDVKLDLALFFKLIRIECRKHMISFQTEIQGTIRVSTGRGELEQIILNLIRNAQDSLKKNVPGVKKIRLCAYIQESHVVIEIIDNGKGIPGHLGRSIFEPHFSLKQSSGLGLYLVKMLVQKNNGTIEYIQNEEGTCFRLILPSGGL
jgi:signal transduction histidine kinase